MDAAQIFYSDSIGGERGGMIALMWDFAGLVLALAAVVGSAALLGAAVALMIGAKRSFREMRERGRRFEQLHKEHQDFKAEVMADMKKKSKAGQRLFSGKGIVN
jgi:hypothetical protein